MAAGKASPSDTTGRIREAAVAAQIEEQQEATNRMAMATAQAQVDLETRVIDATEPNRVTVIVDEPTVVGTPSDDTVEIRVVEDIEHMTFGVGNQYSFKAGQKYKVARSVADHLRAKGYLANTW
jgi:hypothetical protein